jgi:hypothetical protein
MPKKKATAAELRRAGERAKRAVRRAVLEEDFRELDRIVFAGWVASRYASEMFASLVAKEMVPGGPLFHPFFNRLRLLAVLQGQPDPAAKVPPSPRPN